MALDAAGFFLSHLVQLSPVMDWSDNLDNVNMLWKPPANAQG